MGWMEYNGSEFQDPNRRPDEGDELHSPNTRHPKRAEDDYQRDRDSFDDFGDEDRR